MRLPVDIHIGTEKTGSTAIQDYLNRNQQALIDDQRILVPTSLGKGTSVNLAAACQLSDKPDSLRKMRGLQSSEQVNQYYKKLAVAWREEIERQQPKRLLLSCENFSSRLKTEDEIRQLLAFVEPYASSVRILVYLRRQDAMIRSAYTTKIKNGFKGKFKFPEPGQERHDVHYDALLDRWAGVFSKEAIFVRLYEKNRLHKQDVITDFCTTLEIPLTLERSSQRKNAFPGRKNLEMTRLLNSLVPVLVDGKKPNVSRADIAQALSSLTFDDEPIENETGSTSFLQRFTNGNQAVARQWFHGDPSIPPDLFEGNAVATNTLESEGDVEFSTEEFLQTTAHLWNYCQEELQSTRLQVDCLKGELLLAQDKLMLARALLENLHKKSPSEPAVLHLLAQLESQSGNTKEALTLAKSAQTLAPDNKNLETFIAELKGRPLPIKGK